MSRGRQDPRLATGRRKPAPGTRRRRRMSERDLGWFSNYVGGLYLWSGIDFPEHPAFFNLAIRKFEDASRALPEAYQPYENIGDARRFKAQALHGEAAADLLYQAVRDYSTALALVRSHPSRSGEAHAMARDHVITRIQVACATAQVLTGDPDLRRQALNTIRSWDWVEKPGNWSMHPVVRIAYNAASLYALIHRSAADPREREQRFKQASAPRWAYKHLAYTLVAGTSEDWRHVDTDPDFESVREGIGALKRSARILLANDPELSQGDWLTVVVEMDKAVSQAMFELTKGRSPHGDGAA
jgi:hypothetical protein